MIVVLITSANYRLIFAAIGNQYNELARILLSVHNPGLPTVGPLRRRFAQEADVCILMSALCTYSERRSN